MSVSTLPPTPFGGLVGTLKLKGKRIMPWNIFFEGLRSVFIFAMACTFLAGMAWANGEEEDEGHPQDPIILIVGKTYQGAVGSFGDSYYAFKATDATHTLNIIGTPIVSWRLFEGSDYEKGLLIWCKGEKTRDHTSCSIKKMKPGKFYYFIVYNFAPKHTNFKIEISSL